MILQPKKVVYAQARIDWDKMKRQAFVKALSTYFSRFPKHRLKRTKPKRKRPEYIFIP